MAAYAGLVSLSKVIDLSLSQKQEYVLPYSREQMMSLREELGRLQDLLEHLSGRSHLSIDVLESRIRDVAYRLEDIIEGDISRSLSEKFEDLSPVAMTSSTFGSCAGEISLLLGETKAMKMKGNNLQDNVTSGASHPLTTTSSSSQAPSAKLDLNQNEIMDRIFGRGSNLEITPITGMGGIGKTTLARAVYEHPTTLSDFDIRLWVTVSQEYNVEEILRGLLSSDQQNVLDERLIECVHQRLIGRRFLVVLDDMWDVKAWDGVRNAFNDDNKGRRIIITTRLLDVAAYVASSSHVHEMQFLKDDQSWNLLREKVGENKHWSQKLEDLGRTISRNCKGLPLAVVAMAGLLKFNMTEQYWKQVARDTTKSEKAANDDHLLGILTLSYTNLPPYLKACFLYFGLFKEDSEITTKELVRLWTAEGFLRPRGSKEMEVVGEEYLEELVARSLVLVKKKRPGGRIRTCIIHDALRDLSLRKAHEEKFSRYINWLGLVRYSSDDLRRSSFENSFPKELVEQGHHIHARSLRFRDQLLDESSVICHLRLIRVLGTIRIRENSQLTILYELTNLRYLHIYLDPVAFCSPPLIVGESISKLQKLETLIFSGGWWTSFKDYTLVLPSEIWEMPRLRHLILLGKSRLPCPALDEVSCSGLQTLTQVTNFDLTRSMTAKLSNLKKLKLFYNCCISGYKTPFRLNNLVHLHQLEELNVACNDVRVEVTDFSFPHKLKKLSLQKTKMPVKNMSLIGSLPNLEVLKLKASANEGNEWEPVEGEFLQLKYLLVRRLGFKEWKAESEHFPQLETLIIKKCRLLKEVPAGIGEINTLRKLVLKNCKDAEESVKEIQVEQERLCNDFLQVFIIR